MRSFTHTWNFRVSSQDLDFLRIYSLEFNGHGSGTIRFTNRRH